MKEYCFTGDRKILKKIGFKFYKRFYSNDIIDIFIYQKMRIQQTNLDSKNQPKFIEFILENINQPKEFWVKDIVYKNPKLNLTDMPIYAMTKFGNILIVEDYYEKKYLSEIKRRELIGKNPENEKEIYSQFFKENEYIKDPTYFGLDTINSILELHKIHNLELI